MHTKNRIPRFIILFLFYLLVQFLAASPIRAQEHNHSSHSEHLHFVHPLVTESISPDTKVRLDYTYRSSNASYELELEGEYAFTHFLSFEGGVHFNPSDQTLGETHFLFKFANFELAER